MFTKQIGKGAYGVVYEAKYSQVIDGNIVQIDCCVKKILKTINYVATNTAFEREKELS